jgi:hypothetical protein
MSQRPSGEVFKSQKLPYSWLIRGICLDGYDFDCSGNSCRMKAENICYSILPRQLSKRLKEFLIAPD